MRKDTGNGGAQSCAPTDTDTSNPSELPKGWVWTRLGDIVTSVKGKKPKNLGEQNELLKVPYINIEAFERKSFNQFTNGDNCPRCEPSDILIVWDGARCGLVGRGVAGAIGSTLSKLVCHELEPSYLFNFLQSKYKYINRRPKGIGIPHVEPAILWNIEFPLPPLAEQQRIVAKIEELFTELDAGAETLQKVKAQLKRYRLAVLKHAFEGKLTQAWRKAHRGELEPASVLLERIRAERAKTANVGAHSRASRARAPRPYTTDISSLPQLPDGWVWTRLGDVSDAIGGFAFRSSDFKEEGRHQVVKIANVKIGHLRLDEKPSFINDVTPETVEKYGLRYGDLVITLTGTRKKRDYGFVAMVKSQKNLLLNQRLAVIRLLAPLLPEYFQYALRSEYFQENFFKYETGNVGQGNVSMNAIIDGEIFVPPLSEQNKIVEEIERRFSIADEIEKVVEQSLKQAEKLRQSISKKAFEGKLGPQEPNDEPADKLLERIKQAKSEDIGAQRAVPLRKKRQVHHGK